MKILVIDNGKLPFKQSENIEVVQLKRPTTEAKDFDSWVSQKMTEVLYGKEYSLFVLPFSLSADNYAEFSGLKVAAFIRLMYKDDIRKAPILFNGPEDMATVSALSDLSTILLTPKVYIENQLLTNVTLCEWFNREFGNNNPNMTDKQYERFLSVFVVPPPSKYDSRHAIANEWAVHRWADMLNIQLKEREMENLLFYRLMRAKLKESQNFNKKWRKEHSTIGKINFGTDDKKRIALIDDEYSKGWEEVLRDIIETRSGQELVVFKGFDPRISKSDTLNSIYCFINENPADCYLIDLRLHEDDANSNIEDLSGHKLANYILNDKDNGNRGRQIIVFTASNKAWNLEKEKVIGASAYIIKESPEQLLTRQESYQYYADLENALKDACAQSYIKDLVSLVKKSKVSGLNGFIDALILDKTIEKKRSQKVLLLLIVFFVEDYINRRFMFSDFSSVFGSYKLSERDGEWSYKVEKELQKLNDKDLKKKEYNKAIDEYLFVAKNAQINSSYEWAKPQRDNGKVFSTTLIACILKFFYHRNQKQINLFMAFIRERNRVAHENAECKIPIADIIDIINDIIKPMLENPISIPSSEKTN